MSSLSWGLGGFFSFQTLACNISLVQWLCSASLHSSTWGQILDKLINLRHVTGGIHTVTFIPISQRGEEDDGGVSICTSTVFSSLLLAGPSEMEQQAASPLPGYQPEQLHPTLLPYC